MLLGSEGIDQCGMLGRMDGFLFAIHWKPSRGEGGRFTCFMAKSFCFRIYPAGVAILGCILANFRQANNRATATFWGAASA